jgi:hypothetical protein
MTVPFKKGNHVSPASPEMKNSVSGEYLRREGRRF